MDNPSKIKWEEKRQPKPKRNGRRRDYLKKLCHWVGIGLNGKKKFGNEMKCHWVGRKGHFQSMMQKNSKEFMDKVRRKKKHGVFDNPSKIKWEEKSHWVGIGVHC